MKKMINKGGKCIECKGHVAAYSKYLCEECWAVALNENFKKEDKQGEKVFAGISKHTQSDGAI